MNGKDDSDALPRKGYFRCLCFQRGCRFYSEPCSWRMRKHGVSEGRGRAEGHLGSCQVLGIPPAAATQSTAIMEGLSSPPQCQRLWAKTNDGGLRSLDAGHSGHLPDESISGAPLPQGPSPGGLGPLVASSGIAAFPTRSPRATTRMP